MTRRLLVIHYSLTGQADLAAELAIAAAQQEGWEVTARQIVFAPGERTPKRPFRISDAKFWTQAAQKGAILKVQLDRAVSVGRFDAAIIFSNTWGDSPSVPIRSFLTSPQARDLLTGVPCSVFVVCRRLWQKNAAATRDLVEQAGGRVVETVPLIHHGGNLGSLAQTVTHMFRSGDIGLKSLFGIPLPPFGLSPGSLAKVAPSTKRLLEVANVH